MFEISLMKLKKVKEDELNKGVLGIDIKES
jgi:hypothetical protein